MAWPEHPERAADLPTAEWSYVDFELMTDGLSRAVASFASSYKEELEHLTGSDINKERLLGSLLIKVAAYGQGAGRQEEMLRQREKG